MQYYYQRPEYEYVYTNHYTPHPYGNTSNYSWEPRTELQERLTTHVDQAGQVWKWSPYWGQWMAECDQPVVQRNPTQNQGSWYTSAAYANKGTYWDGEKWTCLGKFLVSS